MSRIFDEEDEYVKKTAELAKESGATVIYVLNKADLDGKLDESHFDGCENVIKISAHDANSKQIVSETVNRLFISGQLDNSDGAVITNARQQASVLRALALCKSASEALDSLGPDIAGSELERAMSEISELDGREVGVDVVNEIFGKFCVGK